MSFPHLDLAAGAHDRVGARRTDEDWLAAAWAHPEARVLVVAGSRVRPRAGALEWVPPEQAPEGTRVLLGSRDDRVWWAVLIEPVPDLSDWVGLRAVLADLATATDAMAPLVFHAIGLAEWHASTRYCPRCGQPLDSRAAGHELHCSGCGRTQFPRTDPAVIMAISSGEPGSPQERLLLGRQASWSPGRFSTLAGFCEPGESLEDAVRREVAEEVGVQVGQVDYFGNQPWPFPASLMLGMTGRAMTEEIIVDPSEIETACWFTRSQLRAGAAAGDLVLPGGVSISRSLVEHWYGGPLPGAWG